MSAKDYRISPSVYRRRVVSNVASAALFLTIIALLYFFRVPISRHPLFPAISGIILVCDLVFAHILAKAQKLNTQIQISSAGISLEKGSFIHTEKSIPYRNITMVTRTIGPIDQYWNHERIRIRAASTEILLPHLPRGSAKEISNILGVPLKGD